MRDPDPAQRQFVRQLIDWATVERRLNQFPAIAGAFPLDHLKSGTETPPYYCHYMAWRLGTWKNESRFRHFNKLLDHAKALPGWSGQKSLLTSADFAEFWSLVWQLQIAEYLGGVGSDVRWEISGPDLSVNVESERWFVECYAYRKSFGLMLFLEEVLRQIDPSIRVTYDLCIPFCLPTDGDRSEFLDSMLSPFKDSTFIEDARFTATQTYPVVLRRHNSGLVVYMEGSDANAYVPGVVPNHTGDPQGYLAVALREAISAKRNTNALAKHHPNLVAVNYVLSMDFQLAIGRADDIGLSLPELDLGANIDALAVAAMGIDERLTHRKLMRVASGVGEPLALRRITSANGDDV